MVTGIVDVGGGMRGIYSAGILDFLMEVGIGFDKCIGVSAGSANLISFLAHQEYRNYKFYTDYAFRKEYMGKSNLLKSGNFINLEYIYGELSNKDGEYPLDFLSVKNNPSEFLVVATDAHTGKAKYFSKDELKQDNYKPLMASSCVPGVNKPYFIKGFPYFDGALSDPIPLDKAFEIGCDRVVLIVTKPIDFIRTNIKDLPLARMIERKYPLASEGLLKRAERYNEGMAKAIKLQKDGKVFIFAPKDISGVDTLKMDRESLVRLYKSGYADARGSFHELEEFLGRQNYGNV